MCLMLLFKAVFLIVPSFTFKESAITVLKSQELKQICFVFSTPVLLCFAMLTADVCRNKSRERMLLSCVAAPF